MPYIGMTQERNLCPLAPIARNFFCIGAKSAVIFGDIADPAKPQPSDIL